MNKLNEMLAMGREQAVSQLYQLSGNTDGLTIPVDERQKIVASLRSLADAVETRPETVVGVVIFAGEKVNLGQDNEGINSCAVIAGCAPIVAAAHLQLEEHGRSAMNDCLPALVRGALEKFISGDVEAPATVQ